MSYDSSIPEKGKKISEIAYPVAPKITDVENPDCCEKTGEFKKLEYPVSEFAALAVGVPKNTKFPVPLGNRP